MATVERLLPRSVQQALVTEVFGRRMYYLCEVDSTNRLAKTLAALGEAEGTVVATDFQTHGRGRRDHHWFSAPSENLLFSLILRPTASPAEVLPLTLAFSVAIADMLSERLQRKILVKWPNDIVTGDGKLGGILAEGSTRAGRLDYVVAGVGINVNMKAQRFPDGTDAVSCASLSGQPHDRAELLALLLSRLEQMYREFAAGGFARIAPHYNSRLALRGRRVEFVRGGRGRSGEVIGVEHDGALAVRLAGDVVALYDEEIAVSGG